jgi:hypothetical protein
MPRQPRKKYKISTNFCEKLKDYKCEEILKLLILINITDRSSLILWESNEYFFLTIASILDVWDVKSIYDFTSPTILDNFGLYFSINYQELSRLKYFLDKQIQQDILINQSKTRNTFMSSLLDSEYILLLLMAAGLSVSSTFNPEIWLSNFNFMTDVNNKLKVMNITNSYDLLSNFDNLIIYYNIKPLDALYLIMHIQNTQSENIQETYPYIINFFHFVKNILRKKNITKS